MDSATTNRKSWLTAVLFAMPIILLILTLFTYWFAFADRYLVFLYNHDMGPVVPDTSPFSRVTSSRYWMAGLVASGFVIVLYSGINWLIGRLSAAYQPPTWWRIWLICAIFLTPGILLITMTANQPPLPFGLAFLAALMTLAGLALALLPGAMAAHCPSEMLWLAADGIGMAVFLIFLSNFGLILRWLTQGDTWRVILLVGIFGSTFLWLMAVTILRFWRQTPMPKVTAVFLSSFCVAYLFLPLIHYLFATNGYFYITNSDNFFARTFPQQLLAWLLAGGIAWLLVRVRVMLAVRGTG